MKRPYCVALTGGIGSGKSVVATAFAGLGVAVIDTDLIAHELTAPGGAAQAPILSAFGAEYRLADGGLDRRRMRATIFSQPDLRARLEGILHPLIRACAAQRLNDTTALYALLVVPLLVESGAYRELTDRVLVVDCDPDRQIERIMRRDGIDLALAKAMLTAQASREQRLALADDVIDNRGVKADVEAEVRRLHQVYLRLAGKRGKMQNLSLQK
ncbi:MAG: dephospho-CoA kinase [Hydrogenophilales bacterium CG03_land_8_20_14_0_80_62_28]|nr:MAG: dephospho-CoA kinase [Hydrogenophilaceae bacterium CG1_02_62_390]PIV23365.1 MAG: dephospho-CoA kinase [Hydrogenophilales bacterium CG03_land_8_20_14_0_80_62_28]PIW37789.1 MAG: dephospho-CoA kinase [Hydrogenophilales bacterium CG15_BIG_FIL_POST_REV_8_21_14_020_62_31]PIW72287.1 MAG: dephospho-CoA kinase [Hydrogenophilales bacterium CG12_big_fil_rev_8_21_14_0_65_61_21]